MSNGNAFASKIVVKRVKNRSPEIVEIEFKANPHVDGGPKERYLEQLLESHRLKVEPFHEGTPFVIFYASRAEGGSLTETSVISLLEQYSEVELSLALPETVLP